MTPDPAHREGRPAPRRLLDPRRILARPALYRGFAALVGAHGSRSELLATYVRPRPGDRVLDVGCGPGDLLEVLHDVEYVGVDMDPRYIAEARARFGDRGVFRLGPAGAETMAEEDHYDLVLAFGLLHHLDDDEVRDLMRRARRSLKPGGRLVTVDPCYAPGQSRVARLLLDLDRGEHVRPVEAWPPLVEPVFPGMVTHVRHDLLRVPYTHLVMEGTAP